MHCDWPDTCILFEAMSRLSITCRSLYLLNLSSRWKCHQQTSRLSTMSSGVEVSEFKTNISGMLAWLNCQYVPWCLILLYCLICRKCLLFVYYYRETNLLRKDVTWRNWQARFFVFVLFFWLFELSNMKLFL